MHKTERNSSNTFLLINLNFGSTRTTRATRNCQHCPLELESLASVISSRPYLRRPINFMTNHRYQLKL
ncbi:unnamed protein product [Allacma fusca]|uniref:Uncharacterized protein n=1 Tax=Allacma fusca TaxID=39272 RepID=A0A8J2NZV4_9HEXA|nr:unnamed protein product [Allacma fusca]